MRAHPAIVDLCGIDYDDKVRDLSQYDDMADLLLVSDMLITDYSSSAGDFALLGRPLILYQADRLEYLRDDRELYFDMETSPYYVAATQEDLEKTVTEITQDDVKKIAGIFWIFIIPLRREKLPKLLRKEFCGIWRFCKGVKHK